MSGIIKVKAVVQTLRILEPLSLIQWGVSSLQNTNIMKIQWAIKSTFG